MDGLRFATVQRFDQKVVVIEMLEAYVWAFPLVGQFKGNFASLGGADEQFTADGERGRIGIFVKGFFCTFELLVDVGFSFF